MGVIYKITSPTGRIYVGKTKRPKIRVWEYRWRSKKRKSIVHDSIKGYGWEAHKFEIIEELPDEMLNEREKFWVKELNTFYLDNPLGMNMTRGGDGGGQSWMHDIERRKKQSESRKGVNGTFYGRHHTEENKKLISKLARERNLKEGRLVPEWGAEKGREIIRKPVICYNKNGDFLSEHKSLSSAALEYSVSSSQVSACCRGDVTGVSGEYIFKFKGDNPVIKIDATVIKVKTVKRPIWAFDRRFSFLGEYPSAAEAAEYFEIPKTTINRAAMYNNLHPIRKGFIFVYKDEAEKKFEEKGISIRIL